MTEKPQSDASSEELERLRHLYRDVTGLSAPRNLRAPLLDKLIGWHLRCIERSTPSREAFFYRAQTIQQIEIPKRSQLIASSDVIIREYNGKTHVVRRKADGTFLYARRSYSSLTAVAKAITGIHQSGPRFFGFSNASKTHQ